MIEFCDMMSDLLKSKEDEIGGDLDDEFGNQNQVDEDAQKLLALLKTMDRIDKKIRAEKGLPPRERGLLDFGLRGDLPDEELFASPPPRPDCPICCLPMSRHQTYQPCCGKIICDGCVYAHEKANEYNCPFCRYSAHWEVFVESSTSSYILWFGSLLRLFRCLGKRWGVGALGIGKDRRHHHG